MHTQDVQGTIEALSAVPAIVSYRAHIHCVQEGGMQMQLMCKIFKAIVPQEVEQPEASMPNRKS